MVAAESSTARAEATNPPTPHHGPNGTRRATRTTGPPHYAAPMRSSTRSPVARALTLALLATALVSQDPPTPTPTPLPQLVLPAFTGYAHPDPDAIERRDDGGVPRCDGELHLYVDLAHTGELTLRLERMPDSPNQELLLRVEPTNPPTPTNPPAAQQPHLAAADDLGTFPITTPGTHRITLRTRDGSPLRGLHALHLSGPAATDAHANTAERRNAASVHLGYPVPKPAADTVEWFYCEVTQRTDPLWTYYMATGWHRGYFGMQVNSASERRLIFSVWDAGDEAVDRGKVADQNRVRLIKKGERVHAGDFGNEGTGGHSHLVHDWRLGDTFRFLLHARKDGDATIYSGFFWFAAEKRWGLIASFRAPKDGTLPHGLYSFSENFHGGNGDEARDCEFGAAWVRTTNGTWLPLLDASFTHDETGKNVRRDRRGGVRGNRFFLQHGDFVSDPAGPMRYGTKLHVPASDGAHPSDAELPKPEH